MKKYFKKIGLLSSLIVIASFHWSCVKDGATPAWLLAAKNPNPAIPANLFALVNKYACWSCHAPTIVGTNFQDLTTAQTCYKSWVGVIAVIQDCPGTRVIKGDATDSILIKRLQGVCSIQMPYGGPYMSAAEIQQFIDWINQGAQPQ